MCEQISDNICHPLEMTRSRIAFDWTTLLSAKLTFFALFRPTLLRSRSHVLDRTRNVAKFDHFGINLRLTWLKNHKIYLASCNSENDNDLEIGNASWILNRQLSPPVVSHISLARSIQPCQAIPCQSIQLIHLLVRQCHVRLIQPCQAIPCRFIWQSPCQAMPCQVYSTPCQAIPCWIYSTGNLLAMPYHARSIQLAMNKLKMLVVTFVLSVGSNKSHTKVNFMVRFFWHFKISLECTLW